MNDFNKIEEIYHQVLAVPAADRPRLLADLCGDDSALREEVEQLVRQDEDSTGFLDTPPNDIAAAVLTAVPKFQLVGKKLGRYEIVAPLGAGGMGEVYEAADVRLGRRIALKILPPHFSEDSDRKRRFEQEARAASALNHPNIITIYDNESADGFDFIVAELIEGETLRERLAKSPLEWRQVVDISVQIAAALDAAHAVGIIHRDIKPANIMIRPDGVVKVLDFGLAKLSPASKVNGEDLTREMTDAARVMGTINYMSPEQALGETVDARTDIFSLGAVIYEMLDGRPPFDGASEAAIYNSILNHPPAPIARTSEQLPKALEQLVLHALEKNRNSRYQTAGALRDDLLKILEDSSVSFSFQTSSGFFTRNRRALLAFPVAAVFILLIAALIVAFRAPDQPRNYNYAQLTSAPGEELDPAVSPDGKSFVYTSRDNGDWDIFIRRIDGSDAVNLTADYSGDDKQPAFSRDGQRIAFRSQRDGGGLFLMNTDGSGLRKIVDGGFHPSFSPDGREIAYGVDDFPEPGNRSFVPSALMSVNVETGENRILTDGDGVQPNWSPNGHRIAFWGLQAGGNRDVLTVSANGGEPVAVSADAAIDWNPVWSADGRFLYFVSNRSGSMNLWRVPIDEESGRVTGEFQPLTVPSNYSHTLSFTSDGKSFLHTQSTRNVNILRLGFDAAAEKILPDITEITSGTKVTTNPDISPDGSLLLFDSVGGLKENLSVINVDGTSLRQLTNEAFKDRTPRWSSDGKTIAFFSDRTGRYEGWLMDVETGKIRQMGDFSHLAPAQMPTWSPDPRRLLLNTSNSFPVIIDLNDDLTIRATEYLNQENAPFAWFMAYNWSPDGRYLAGYGRSVTDLTSRILVYDLAERRFFPVFGRGNCPLWLKDSRRFIYTDGRKLMLQELATGRTKEIFSVSGDSIQAISISRDNRQLYVSVRRSESDIWMATEK